MSEPKRFHCPSEMNEDGTEFQQEMSEAWCDDPGCGKCYVALADYRSLTAHMELTDACYKLAVKERDYERFRYDRLKDSLLMPKGAGE